MLVHCTSTSSRDKLIIYMFEVGIAHCIWLHQHQPHSALAKPGDSEYSNLTTIKIVLCDRKFPQFFRSHRNRVKVELNLHSNIETERKKKIETRNPNQQWYQTTNKCRPTDMRYGDCIAYSYLLFVHLKPI